MPAQRLAMRQVRAVLRLKWSGGLSDRKIAHSLGISRPTIAEATSGKDFTVLESACKTAPSGL